MNKLILSLILVVAACSQTRAELHWGDLRLTWGPTKEGAAFDRVPRSIQDPLYTQQKWKRVSTKCENDGTFHGFQTIIPGDIGAALLFDVKGVIAGMQMLFKKSTLLVPGNNVNYPALPFYQSQNLEGDDYFRITIYFVEPSIICTTGRSDGDLSTVGTGTQVIIQNGTSPSGSLLRIPKTRAVAIKEGWSKNNCYAGMGHHNFYQVEQYQSHNCTQIFPFCGLYDNAGEMHGFGVMFPGTVVHRRFEDASIEAINLVLEPVKTPKCVLETEKRIGFMTMHIFFIDTPWLITC